MNIVIAGAGKGIGKAVAELAQKKGHAITAVSRTLADNMNKPYRTILCNIENDSSVGCLAGLAATTDAVINCTGTHPGLQYFGKGWDSKVMNIVNQNVTPATHLYQAFLPAFRETKKGHLIHVSSGALDGYDGSESGYCASKAALESLVLCLQNEDKSLGTKVLHHAIRVSLTDTPLARKVCPHITDWNQFYTAEETAKLILDVAERPELYAKPIVSVIPYRPMR
jgi:NAD(P)-dependent dehydrogenase (short-subunit alcohol dehydrogenase family)